MTNILNFDNLKIIDPRTMDINACPSSNLQVQLSPHSANYNIFTTRIQWTLQTGCFKYIYFQLSIMN